MSLLTGEFGLVSQPLLCSFAPLPYIPPQSFVNIDVHTPIHIDAHKGDHCIGEAFLRTVLHDTEVVSCFLISLFPAF